MSILPELYARRRTRTDFVHPRTCYVERRARSYRMIGRRESIHFDEMSPCRTVACLVICVKRRSFSGCGHSAEERLAYRTGWNLRSGSP